jgi:DNA repair protein RadC
LLLDVKQNVIGLNTASIGILDSALAHPREIFKAAILANAASIILAHNHPSGDPTPSPEDRRLTERLKSCGELLHIEVIDHIIVGGEKGRFVSLKENGLF